METFFILNYAEIEKRFQEEFPQIKTSEKEEDGPKEEFKIHKDDSVKLPKISLEKFTGDYRKWTTFHDLFKTLIHENKSISAIQKLKYLKMHLGGEAKQLLRHFQVTGNNYKAAWEFLENRYDNKRVLVNAQLKVLLSQGALGNETPHGVKNLLDTTSECLQALKNLEINTSGWDPLIVYLTVQKLPPETHQLWEQSLNTQKELPKWKELQDFLEGRFRTLEAIATKKLQLPAANKKNYQPPKMRNVSQSFHVSTKATCCICPHNHSIRQCPKFLEMSDVMKLETVKQRGLCMNCLGQGQMSLNCPSRLRCIHCQGRHHSLLHRKTLIRNAATSREVERNENAQSINAHVSENRGDHNSSMAVSSPLSASATDFTPRPGTSFCDMNSYVVNSVPRNHQILLATALVKVTSSSGREQILRALIDQGSQASFITETAAQDLQLPKEAIKASVSGLGQTTAGHINAKVQMTLKSRNGDNESINATGFVLQKLTHVLPSKRIWKSNWEHIQGLELADPSYSKPGKIDLLLGADVYGKILLQGLVKGRQGAPIAQKTLFGWILSGEVDDEKLPVEIRSFHVTAELDKLLKLFWELEETSDVRSLTKEEKDCEKHFTNHVKRNPDGRYEVSLPFVEDEEKIAFGKSRDIAIARLLQMEKRFKKDPSLKVQYSSCLQEYVELGHMKAVQSTEEDHLIRVDKQRLYSCCYLPHHAVIKESSSTTKVRVVFDASRETTNGKSLNDLLMKGPTIQDELASLLLRWRKHKIAFTSDVEKMYRQIRVMERHSKYQRIVWRSSEEDPIEDYQLLTVTFGTKSAPYLATRVLKQLALDEQETYPMASAIALNDFYVDDLMLGSDSVEQAKTKQNELIRMMKSGGFQLRKWASNCPEVLENVPEEQREINLPFSINIQDNIKALGVHWNPATDNFLYSLRLGPDPKIFNKRNILSDVAKLFDPLGWLAPAIIPAKIMIQRLWLLGIGWDESVPEEIADEWQDYRKKLQEIKNINIPRWIMHSPTATAIEYHGFCDASTRAYGAVVYLCVTDNVGKRHVSLISAKTKVAPIKTVSLPRLELCGAVLLAKLIKYTQKSMRFSIKASTHTWTDSAIVIAWLKGYPSKWTTFVANRVTQIHELLQENSWKHVSSKENPADCASRGISVSELQQNSLWWTGPEWLQRTEKHWPKLHDMPTTELEMRKAVSHVATLPIEDEWLERYSSLNRLLRVTAYCQRYVKNLKIQKKDRMGGELTSNEINNALTFWLRKIQDKHFSEEIKQLRESIELKRSSNIIKLNPFVDIDGLLRVGGRLQQSDLDHNEKHPIILPGRSHLTKLIILKTHLSTLHGGPQLMMTVLRKKYWILNCRNLIRMELHKCIPCFRQKKETRNQLMGNLPSPRVRISRPFSHSGVDYCGPFDMKMHKGRGSKTYKAYVAIFVCFATKAIHIELVTDLSSNGFIAAFRRFVSRRGLCSDLYSDCGSNFIGANSILTRQKQQMIDACNVEVIAALENEGVKWHFIPPASPHFGGLWEAGVKSTKYHIKRIFGSTLLTYEEFNTALTQIEACLNSRPLCEISTDPDDLTPLTPAHFLIGDILLTPPEPTLLNTSINHLDRWQYVQRLYHSFWCRWNTEYLNRLQQRPKWTQKKPSLEVGDLVILKEDNIPPSRWTMARITETHPGSDGLVRVVTAKTRNSLIKRSITKICRLPIDTRAVNRSDSQ